MCLYPTIIRNPKYRPNKKNCGIPPRADDKRKLLIPIGCGVCSECLNKEKRKWQVRLHEEVKVQKHAQFVTLTFDEERLQYIKEKLITRGNQEPKENDIAIIAVHDFLERWRKKYKKSPRHWLVTELGHKGTERLHLHGIIFEKENVEERWQNGWVYVGDYVNEKTVNYIIKYITKTDLHHKWYKPKVLCSPGIGRAFTDTLDARRLKYTGRGTKAVYRLKNGRKIDLPIYYRNKIFTDEEREEMWMGMLDREERYVKGDKIDVSKSQEEYDKAVIWQRKRDKELGYIQPDKYNAELYANLRDKLEKNTKLIQKEWEKFEESENNNYIASETNITHNKN